MPCPIIINKIIFYIGIDEINIIYLKDNQVN